MMDLKPDSPMEQPLDVCTIPLNRSAMIGASAGTGKTYTITYLVLRLLLGSGGAKGFGRPLPLEQLLIVTFTRAAASDLRERIREKIRTSRKAFEAVAEGRSPEALESKLQELINELTEGGDKALRALTCARLLLRAERGIDDAAISTIHSFANSSLNQIYSFEAGRAFEVELTDDDALRELKERARTGVWRELFYPDEAKGRDLLQIIAASSPEELNPFPSVLSKVRMSHAEEGVKTVLGYAVTGGEFDDFTAVRSAQGLKERLFARARKSATAIASCERELNEAWKMSRSFFKDYRDFEALKAGRSDNFQKFKLIAKCSPFVNTLFTSGDELSLEGLTLLLNGSYPSFDDFAGGFFGPNFKKNAARLDDGERLFIEDFERRVYGIYDPVDKLYRLLEPERMLCRTLIAILILKREDELCERYGKLSQNALLLELDAALHDKERGGSFASVLRSRYPVAMIDEFQDTDPVQFSIFGKLYLERGREKTLCFLIGDPKQSIYGFRNADIHSYTIAKAALEAEGGAGGSYTLDTNYRSSEGVVGGVNCIFGGFSEDQVNHSPFLDDDIPYPCVKAHVIEKDGRRISGKWRLVLDQEISKGTRVYFDDTILLDKNGAPSSKRTYRIPMAECAAQVIAHCLCHGELEDKDGNRRRVSPSDIAVLVRGYTEYKAIAAALSSLKLPAVYYSDKSSVLQSQEDQSSSEASLSMLALMEAMSGYSSQGRVLKLMGTPLACLNDEEFRRAVFDGDELEKETEILRECAGLWLNFGFLSAFTLWMRRHATMQRLLSHAGGERQLTDYLQIAELMQEKHNEIFGLQAQLHYFRQLLSGTGTEISPEAVKRRLESEREQIKIYTIHKSKGLEFPLVFLPFLWGRLSSSDSKTPKGLPQVYYDPALKRRVLAISDPQGIIQKSNDDEGKQESMRLLYVALTRACAANFIFISNENIRPPKALVKELQGCLGGDPDFTLLKQLFDKAGEYFTCIDWTLRERRQDWRIQSQSPAEPADLACSSLPHGAVQANFTVSSYSAVTSGLHDNAVPEQSDAVSEVHEEQPSRRITAPDCFSFPAGTAPGSFLHELLEKLDFADLDDLEHNLAQSLYAEIRYKQWQPLFETWHRRSLREGYQGPQLISGELTPQTLAPLTAWFKDIVSAELPGLDGFSLSSLRHGDWIPEMDYLLPTAEVAVSRINELCIKSADEIFPNHAKLRLNEKQLCGFITGSLDLVFRAPMGGRMRYFVADYKSTLLGRSYEAFAPDRITASVFDPKNRYDVQYLFYSLALHRFLKSRLKDYDYGRDFGGVFYLYLRGMRKGSDGSGIFYTKPSLGILNELGALFDGGYCKEQE